MSAIDRRVVALSLLGALLAGCTPDGVTPVTVNGPLTFTLDPVTGAPDPVGQNFASALTAEATRRRLVPGDAGTEAAYRLRAYVSASTGNGQTRFDYVVDLSRIADGRTGRITGTVEAPAADEPWSAIDQAVIARAAASAAEAIAGWVTAA